MHVSAKHWHLFAAQIKIRVLGGAMTALRIEEDMQRRVLQGDRCALCV